MTDITKTFAGDISLTLHFDNQNDPSLLTRMIETGHIVEGTDIFRLTEINYNGAKFYNFNLDFMLNSSEINIYIPGENSINIDLPVTDEVIEWWKDHYIYHEFFIM